MPKTVAEIMDREFAYASQADSTAGLLRHMHAASLASVPVLDVAGRPLGRATLRDLESCCQVEEIAAGLGRSLVSVAQNTNVEAAARTLARHNTDSLVAVDDQGIAVGLVHAPELLRAVLGLPCSRLEDAARTRCDGTWSKSRLFERDGVQHAPAAPGVIVLTSGADAADLRRIRWMEVSENVQERLDAMLHLQHADPKLEHVLAAPCTLHFQVVVVHDPERRARLARQLGGGIECRSSLASAAQ